MADVDHADNLNQLAEQDDQNDYHGLPNQPTSPLSSVDIACPGKWYSINEEDISTSPPVSQQPWTPTTTRSKSKQVANRTPFRPSKTSVNSYLKGL